jgi:hypothetical protein
MLIVPRATNDFPLGDLGAPLTDWKRVTNENFGTLASCRAAQKNVVEALQRPAECVSTEDPRLAGK